MTRSRQILAQCFVVTLLVVLAQSAAAQCVTDRDCADGVCVSSVCQPREAQQLEMIRNTRGRLTIRDYNGFHTNADAYRALGALHHEDAFHARRRTKRVLVLTGISAVVIGILSSSIGLATAETEVAEKVVGATGFAFMASGTTAFVVGLVVSTHPLSPARRQELFDSRLR